MANNNSNGVSGSNVITGGSGNDKLNGGASSDTLNGGAGSDSLNGDSGNDSLIYRLSENGAASDVYTGGSGIDTVRVELTQAEWMSAAVEYQLARYYQHLLTVKTNSKTGEVSNGAASDFTFDFGNGSKLTVQMMERLEIAVDGLIITNQDQPVIKTAPQAAGVVEDGDSDASASTAQSAGGTIAFFDLDLTDSHVVSIATPAGAYGVLTASVSNATLGDSQGTVAWSYQLGNAAVQFLAAGETRTEVFTVRIADANNAANFAESQVTITITGTNDVPVITAEDLVGGVTELVAPTGSLTDSGTISFSDVDLTDVHLVSATGTPVGTTLGSLSAVKNSDTTGSGAGGQLTWTYSVPASAVEYLAAGQTKVESFTISLDDQNGGVISKQIDVTIT
ncbi:MAG: VCBS domain-containing protein, partial [Gammaproteobacteria bacterium]|nr:VCBS domain-containing protein [Gammaproteobacteria bacterium]